MTARAMERPELVIAAVRTNNLKSPYILVFLHAITSLVSSALTKTIITKFTKNVNKNLVIIVLHFEQLFID